MLTAFEKKVLKTIKKIPRGKVSTYWFVALKIGDKNLARAVGNALSKNPRLFEIPCHRVVKNNGKIGNYALGLAKKIKLLQNEGIKIEGGKIANLADCLYTLN